MKRLQIKRRITVYIAGKITGDENYKRKFAKAAKDIYAVLRDDFEVGIINPASLPAGMTNAEYMRFAFASIDAADFIVFLPDWRESAGARLEMAYIDYTGQEDKLTEKGLARGRHERGRG